MAENEPPLIGNPEEASRVIHQAQIDLSVPYVATIGVATWAQVSLDAYTAMGMVSDKVALLLNLVQLIDDYEEQHMAAHMRLGDIYEVLMAIRARREQM